MGTDEKSHRILLKRRLVMWCGEGDLNPHELSPASTSSQNPLYRGVSWWPK